jgi:hypothetical protein
MTMALTTSRWAPIARTQLQSQVTFDRHSGNGTDFSTSTSLFLYQYHFINAPSSSSFTCCCYQHDKKGKPGNPPKISSLLEIVKHCIATSV